MTSTLTQTRNEIAAYLAQHPNDHHAKIVRTNLSVLADPKADDGAKADVLKVLPAKFQKKPTGDQINLRRWCIEEAIRWPMEGSYGGMAAQQFQIPRTEADVIGRAKRILAWVTEAT